MKHLIKLIYPGKEQFMETKHETQIKLFRQIVLFSAFLGISFFFSSCFVDYSLDTTNYDMVGTFYDTTYNFKTVHTYYLSDTVRKIGDGVSSSYDNTIKTRVQDNLNKLGWTPASYTSANVRVMMGITSSTYYVQGSWYDYWGYSGWGWYYPYYPSYSYSYTTGTVLVLMADANTADTVAHKQPLQWMGLLNGLANGSGGTSRINTGIDQAFIQSPYLKP